MFDQEKLDKIYDFLKEINKFKSSERLSVISEGGRRESDAEHTWHLVMSVWVYSYICSNKIDLLHAIKIALVHDLVEIYAGDVYGGAVAELRAGKEEREKQAAAMLFSMLPAELYQEFLTLWQEYESKETEEAKYVWALDKIMPRFQLAMTKTDLADGMPTDNERMMAHRSKIKEISPVFGEVLRKIRKDRGLPPL